MGVVGYASIDSCGNGNNLKHINAIDIIGLPIFVGFQLFFDSTEMVDLNFESKVYSNRIKTDSNRLKSTQN